MKEKLKNLLVSLYNDENLTKGILNLLETDNEYEYMVNYINQNNPSQDEISCKTLIIAQNRAGLSDDEYTLLVQNLVSVLRTKPNGYTNTLYDEVKNLNYRLQYRDFARIVDDVKKLARQYSIEFDYSNNYPSGEDGILYYAGFKLIK